MTRSELTRDTRNMSLAELRDFLTDHLVNFVAPFWPKHAIDREHGGILVGIDLEGREPVYWRNAEKKLWWGVHAETLGGLLVAYEHCCEDWCLGWYHRVHEWSFAHFPVPEHGEWTQRLGREGKKITTLIALPVKDPFHLPRSLIVAIGTLRRLAGP